MDRELGAKRLPSPAAVLSRDISEKLRFMEASGSATPCRLAALSPAAPSPAADSSCAVAGSG